MHAAIKAECDSYLAQAFPGPIPAKQQIEIRLAMYAGMMSMFRMMIGIMDAMEDEDKGAKQLESLHDALQFRARRLNEQRTGL